MYLAQERENKISEITSLKEAIKEKEKYIEEQKKELKMLIDEYNKKQESELPILIFQIDETVPMYYEEKDCFFESVYYCPDIEETKYIIEHDREKMLPNAIDLRKAFEDFGVPKKKWTGRICEYSDNVQEAISVLRLKINDLIVSVDINTWNELGECLVDLFLEKTPVKTLKKDDEHMRRLEQIIRKDWEEDE